jgi:ADP-ribose pyrophosphatase
MTRQIVHHGRRITVAIETVDLPDGSSFCRDLILHPGGVVILPLIDQDTICLLRVHRFAVEADLWELPAGGLEPGEDPLLAGQRELREETGYEARSWRKLLDFFTSPGFLSEVLHVYLATDLTPGLAAPEAGEELRAHAIPFKQALDWSRDGTIRDGKTLLAILWWERWRAR